MKLNVNPKYIKTSEATDAIAAVRVTSSEAGGFSASLGTGRHDRSPHRSPHRNPRNPWILGIFRDFWGIFGIFSQILRFLVKIT